MSKEVITIESVVKAPVGTVWRYWNNPDHITQWNFASEDWCCPNAENDPRPGGRYRARMEAKDGSMGFDFEAVYDDVSEHEALAYTLTDGRRVKTVFEAGDGSTRVVTTFEAEQENPTDMQRQGWQAILDNFRNYVETRDERAGGESV